MSSPFQGEHVIVVGGGLAGLSAAHSVIERGGRVLLVDKKSALGGNSVKASSGINGAGTQAQNDLGIQDSVEAFIQDTTASAGPSLARTNLITTLASNSAGALHWLTSSFGVDLSSVAQLGGHSIPRTHRGKGGAPGWAITSALMKKLQTSPKATILQDARVIELLQEENSGRIVGVRCEFGENHLTELGVVVLATGGYAADFSETGLLAQHRHDLMSLPTTNGDHATGDGHRLASSLSHPAALCDMDQVQVHPTGFIDPKAPYAKTKFLAAEALRGVGGLLIDGKGRRFVNELDRRDAVTAAMQHAQEAGRGPLRMIMNVASYEALKAHCDFYISKGLMKRYDSALELCADTQISIESLQRTFSDHILYASGTLEDPFGKKTFENSTYNTKEPLYAAELTPVVHYTMGGISVDEKARVLDAAGESIPGLYAAGEVIGGVHGRNRLGGSSLLEAVVFGRLAGQHAYEELQS